MALITRQAEACIMIGLNHHSLQIPHDLFNFGLGELYKNLKNKIPQYTLILYQVDSSDIELNVFNAHLNFEVATYKNNKITYPYLNEKVYSLLNLEVEKLKSAQAPKMDLGSPLNQEQTQQCKLILYWLDVINKTNKLIAESCCRLSLNFSNTPEVTLKNHRNEVMLISSLNTPNTTFHQALDLILGIQKEAYSLGQTLVNPNQKVKTNSYGCVESQSITDSDLQENEQFNALIKKPMDALAAIDPNGYIPFHEETITENFITSFRSGATSKLTSLAQQIDF